MTGLPPGSAAARLAALTALALALAALLAACAGAPPPLWQANAHAALRSFESAYLGGDGALAAREFARARTEISASGRGDLIARAELVRCALRVASLEADDCPEFAPLAGDAAAADRAYAAYLGARAAEAELALLPAQHRGVAAARDAAAATAALAEIADPTARLVAAGILLRSGRLAPAGIAIAIDTASAQGWRRPLLAWLGLAEKRAEAAGDTDAAAALRRRAELVAGPRR